MSDFTELALIEQPAIDLFAELGYETLDCYHERFGPNGTLGREARHGVSSYGSDCEQRCDGRK